MPDDDETRPPAQVALAVLNHLRSQWESLASHQKVAVAEALKQFWKAIAPRQYSFEPAVKWDAAVDAFLRDVSTAPAIKPVVEKLLSASPQASPVTDAEKEMLLDAVRGFPAPGEPAYPARNFPQPRQALVAIVQDLTVFWPVLDRLERDQIEAAQATLDSVIRGRAPTDVQDAAIAEFLRSLDRLPQASLLLKRTLDAYTKPYARAIDYLRTLGGPYRDAFAKSPVASASDRGAMQSAAPAALPAPLAGSADLMSRIARFYPRVDFPVQVALRAEAVPLVVQLTLQPPEESPVRAIRELLIDFSEPGKPEEAEVVIHPEGFVEVTGDTSRTIRVYSNRVSQPAVFLLRPESPGRHKVTVDFYHNNRPIGCSEFEVTVVETISETGTVAASGSIAGLPQTDFQPPDLELRVITGSDKKTLTFVLHSANPRIGFHWKAAGSVTLESEPQNFFRSTFDKLSRIARSPQESRTPDEDKTYRRQLDTIGVNLYEKLFSPELKKVYQEEIRSRRDDGTIKSLLITSDEPWVPWELVKPFEFDQRTGSTVFDDDFLCRQFRLGRWLVGRGLPATLRIEDAQLVSFADDLEHVRSESDYFARLGQLISAIHVAPPVETADGVLDALTEARAQLYHFACHGNFNTENPDESVLRLKGGSFSPSDLSLRHAAGITKSAPLVFVNACHAGRAGFSLTGLGGWAQRFVNAGASVFIGGLWEVNDTLAADFALRFYEELWRGRTLGDALHQAREFIRSKDETNPTWLAYVLYGDPNGKWTAAK